MMKKLLALIMMLLMLSGVTACKKGGKGGNSGGNESPFLSDISFEKLYYTKNQKINLIFYASNDLVEIKDCWSLISESKNTTIPICGEIKKSGGSYRIEFEVDDSIENGTYYLSKINLKNSAGLSVSYISDDQKHYGNTSIEVPSVKIFPAEEDVTPPVLKSIRVEKTTYQAGSTGSVFFTATDNLTGLYYASIRFSFSQSDINGYELKDLGNNNYRLDFKIGEFVENGIYTLDLISLYDFAGNNWYNGIDNNGLYTGTSVEAPTIEVYGGKEDSTPPVLTSIRVEKSTYQAGSSGSVFFTATDDLSGVNYASINFSLSQSKIRAGGILKDLGNNNYRIDFAIGEFIENGIYTLDEIYLYDFAGNYSYSKIDNNGLYAGTSIEAPTIEVYGGKEDSTPPVLTSIRVEKSAYQAGSTGSLIFSATDDLSGLMLAQMNFTFSQSKIFAGGMLSDIGNNNYRVDFYIGNFVENGIYTIDEVKLTDFAGNVSSIKIDNNGLYIGTPIEAPTIEVYR